MKGIDREARQVTLDHEDIPLKDMTRTFNVAPDVALVGSDPGADVDFGVKDGGGAHTVMEMRRSGS